MNNKTTKNKPLVIAIREAENAIVATVNAIIKSGIPLAVIEMIVDKIHRQLKDGARVELETETRRMIEAEELDRQAELEREKIKNLEKEEGQNGS